MTKYLKPELIKKAINVIDLDLAYTNAEKTYMQHLLSVIDAPDDTSQSAMDEMFQCVAAAQLCYLSTRDECYDSYFDISMSEGRTLGHFMKYGATDSASDDIVEDVDVGAL